MSESVRSSSVTPAQLPVTGGQPAVRQTGAKEPRLLPRKWDQFVGKWLLVAECLWIPQPSMLPRRQPTPRVGGVSAKPQ